MLKFQIRGEVIEREEKYLNSKSNLRQKCFFIWKRKNQIYNLMRKLCQVNVYLILFFYCAHCFFSVFLVFKYLLKQNQT